MYKTPLPTSAYSLPAQFHQHKLPNQKLTPEEFGSCMVKNICRNVSLSTLAQEMGVSLSKFKRVFHDTYNTTPHRWLLINRTIIAFIILINSNKSVTQIANECGFGTPSLFIRHFKEIFGTTPIRYRKQILDIKNRRWEIENESSKVR